MKRGYTLVEAIIASFLLVAALLVISRLFHASLRYSVWSENKAVATYLAENRLAELRRWSSTQNGWTGPPTGNDPGFPAFAIAVRLEDDATIFSPCTQLEQAFAEPRLFQGSFRRAVVDVSWNAGSSKVSLTTLIRDPRRGWRTTDPIEVTGAIPGSVGASDTVLLTATGYSTDGPISDLCFTWSVEPRYPGAGLGSITASRDGRTVRFRNQLVTGAGTIASTGTCRVFATAIYGGEERRGFSEIITLAP